MTDCFWLDLAPRPAAEQMAIDTAMVAVAERAGTTLLRLYRWRGPSVSLGANESALRTWNRSQLEADQVAVVRRPTGGRAVWHAESDLTYSWAGPAAAPAEVRRIYRDLHERLAAAIAQPDRIVALATTAGPPGLVPGACFDVPVGGEVLVGGRKTIGSAQRVYGGQLLQHGAIAVEDRQQQLALYRLDTTAAPRAIEPTTLGEATATATAIADAWQLAGALPASDELTSRTVLASEEYRSHYQDPTWTWRR